MTMPNEVYDIIKEALDNNNTITEDERWLVQTWVEEQSESEDLSAFEVACQKDMEFTNGYHVGMQTAMTFPYYPDWNKAPEWAQWWAIDANGAANWFEEKPYMVEDNPSMWWSMGKNAPDLLDMTNYDWTKTLAGRNENYV